MRSLFVAVCDVVVLVAGTAPPQVACALTVRALVSPGALVLRPGQGDGLVGEDVAAVLGRGTQALNAVAERLDLFRERLAARRK